MKREYLADLVALAPLIVGAALCGWLGYQVGAREVATVRAQHDRAQLAAAEEAGRALADAQHRGDVLTIELAVARAHADTLAQDLQNEITRVTDGRACLREPALRLLDRAPGLSVRVSTPAGGAAAADAGRVATDTGLAGWAVDAGAQYAECARRLYALTSWHGRPAGQ